MAQTAFVTSYGPPRGSRLRGHQPGWRVEPGTLFPGVVAEHFEAVTVPHLFFVSPYLWDGFESRALAAKTVGWLMGIPVSNSENNYALEHGSEALEDLFEQADPNFVDLWREPVV